MPYLVESSLADYGRVVPAPANDYGIQLLDEDYLSPASLASHYFAKLLGMSFGRCPAWHDDCFEPKLSSVDIFAGFGLTLRVVSDIESKKVEARFLIHPVECMGDSGLARLEFQTHVL